ncbi:MAG TPA: hypothetical protein VK716_13695 [Terracidiphilus sp.]|nr:hypothetical protein [Terracidiphilus sp.]
MLDQIDLLLEQLGGVLVALQARTGDRKELLRKRARIYAEIELLRPGTVAAGILESYGLNGLTSFQRIQ